MTHKLEDIKEIVLTLKEGDKKASEVAVFEPFAKKCSFNKNSNPLKHRLWTFQSGLPPKDRLSLKIKGFIYKQFPWLVPKIRNEPQSQFITVLAILLSQEELRELFLGSEERKADFLLSVEKTAAEMHIPFSYDKRDQSPLALSKSLTRLDTTSTSLIDDLLELNLQMASMSAACRNEILFKLLSNISRPIITSTLAVDGDLNPPISVSTEFAYYIVNELHSSGRIDYTALPHKSLSNLIPSACGVVNQRKVSDISNARNPLSLGYYSGELLTFTQVLEQTLFVLGAKGEEVWIEKNTPENVATEQVIFFISLFSWNELGKIHKEHESVDALNGITFKQMTDKGSTYTRIDAFHYNIPFNAFTKFPTPPEVRAQMDDMNAECLPFLSYLTLNKLGLWQESAQLLELVEAIKVARQETDYLKKKGSLLRAVDAFNAKKKALIEKLSDYEELSARFLIMLLESPTLIGMNAFLIMQLLLKEFGIEMSVNCNHSLDRTAGANAAVKAQHAYCALEGKPFIPEDAESTSRGLFKVLYSLYLVWEEPELTAGLSTGFVGEKFHKNPLKRNPETTSYLIGWLKKNPEVFLGLSDFRD